MELRTLPPGQDATYEKRLPAGVGSGTYRYVTSVETPLGSGMRRLASSTFRFI